MKASDFVTFFTNEQYWWVFTFFGICAVSVPAVYYGARAFDRKFPGFRETWERERQLRSLKPLRDDD